MNNKYEFVPGDEITIAPGCTVKRIRALVAIAALGVTPGQLGGYPVRPCRALARAARSVDAGEEGAGQAAAQGAVTEVEQ